MAQAAVSHTDVINGLSREGRRMLLERNNQAGLIRVSVHWSLLIGVGILIVHQPLYWWPLLLPLQGILIISNFSLLHECVHKTPFKSGWLNTLAAWVSGLLVGIPPLWFRHFHTDHHRYTSDPAKDPELASPKPETPGAYVWHLTGISIWFSQAKVLLVNALGRNTDSFIPDKDKPRIVREARFIIVFYGALITGSLVIGSDVLFWVYLAPVLIGQPFLRAYLLAEHGGCPMVANMLENTRTTFTTFFVRFFMWNMPYHIEHHSFPAVPFHKLPALHAHMKKHLGVTVDGYVAFHNQYAKNLSS